ncbi:tetrahydrofolate synthase, partial [Nowakowskiella sp. JEL0078]
MSSTIIDGKKLAESIRSSLSLRVDEMKAKFDGFAPHLTIIQVGTREDSSVYVRMKQQAAEKLLQIVDDLNSDPTVHGILIQLPLPESIDEKEVTEAINPEKDVDGFHSGNIGQLSKKDTTPLFTPCTPKGVIELLKTTGVEISGKIAVVVGRSNIVGMPVAALLQKADATVIVCHSKTKNIETLVKQADILVVAIGKANFVQGSWLKPGVIVIDVGTNAVPDSTKKSGIKWVGDVDFESSKNISSAITPVPGGVGPMTVAMLLENT